MQSGVLSRGMTVCADQGQLLRASSLLQRCSNGLACIACWVVVLSQLAKTLVELWWSTSCVSPASDVAAYELIVAALCVQLAKTLGVVQLIVVVNKLDVTVCCHTSNLRCCCCCCCSDCSWPRRWAW
jgi:hypothetical protein